MDLEAVAEEAVTTRVTLHALEELEKFMAAVAVVP
jgi:hypothetical protein